jgi:hypothetical protein
LIVMGHKLHSSNNKKVCHFHSWFPMLPYAMNQEPSTCCFINFRLCSSVCIPDCKMCKRYWCTYWISAQWGLFHWFAGMGCLM